MTNLTSNVATWGEALPDLLGALGAFPDVPAKGGKKSGWKHDIGFLQRYLKELERLCDIAGERGYVGLQTACMVFQENVQALLEHEIELDETMRGALGDWPELIRSYLEAPLSPDVSKLLTNHLQLPVWDEPLPQEDAEMISLLLQDEAAEDGFETDTLDAFSEQDTAQDTDRLRDRDEGLNLDSAFDENPVQEEAIAFFQGGEVALDQDTELAEDAAVDEVASSDQAVEPDEDAALDAVAALEESATLDEDEASHDSIEAFEDVAALDEAGIPDEVAASDEAAAIDGVAALDEATTRDEDAAVDDAVAAFADVAVFDEAATLDEDATLGHAVAASEDIAAFEGAATLDQDAALDEVAAFDESDATVVDAMLDEGSVFDPVAVAADAPVAEDQPPLAPEQPEPAFNKELPPEILELVEVLLEELPFMEEPLAKLFEIEPEQNPEGWEAAVEVFGDYLDRFGEATEAVGFLGLQQAVGLMRENLGLLALQGRALTPDEQDLLAAWTGTAMAYLSAPYDAAACQPLVDWLQAPEWPLPLPEEEAAPLLSLLQAPDLPEIEAAEAEARAEQATPEDVSLELPEEVNTELLDALLQELPSQTETFSEAIQNLIGGGSIEDVNVAQRMAHTLKGAANTVGVTGLATLTHHLEDILVALAKQQALPTRPLALSLMGAADCLEGMGEALCGIGEPPDNAQAVLQEVLDWTNRIDREGLPAQDEAAPSAAAEARTTEPAPSAGDDRIAEGQPSASPVEPAQQPQQQSQPAASRAKVSTSLVDDLLRLGGESIIQSGQVHEQVRKIDERMHAMQEAFERLQRLGGELERLIDISDLSTDRRGHDETTEFDSLEMDQYSELHTTSRMLVETATDARQMGGMVTNQLQQLDAMLLTQERLNRDTQEKVLSARMVPVKTVVPRLQRSVRQTCRLTGKHVELHINGAETLMDSEVLKHLIDPLMHVLRNAVDHGIESPEARSSAGKPNSGNIRLEFQREGNNILVRCRDDGSGFDYPAIRRAAESRGLLQPGEEASEEELRNLLLTPNFSTRSEVTQTSGRGVGLDVVYSHVLAHGGALALKSEAGKGSTAELRLPVSLISTHALLVRARRQVMAVSDRGIERILHAGDGEQRVIGDQVTFQVDNQIYPLRKLDDILGLAPDRRSGERGPMPVLLVRDRSGVTAVPVQEVLAGTDLVVKEFGRYVPPLPGIVGATILGDGAVTPVLDLPELMSGVRGKARSSIAVAAETATDKDHEQESPPLPLALVVDDSLSARRALAQVMTDAGYEVREARDGHEAVQIVQGRRPEVVLADMEMPRMNGIELTSHLRARPETMDLPVIMITSRSTAKHRHQAEEAGVNVYLTKPFLDDELLDHVARLRGQI